MTGHTAWTTVISFSLTGKTGSLTDVPRNSSNARPLTPRADHTPVVPQSSQKSGRIVHFALLSALLLWIAATPNRAHATGTLSFIPNSASFGSVAVGTSKRIDIVIKNTGTSRVSITQESLVANMYSVSGITLPKTLAPGASFTMTIKFAPTSAKTSIGYVQIGSNATDNVVRLIISGTGVTSSSVGISSSPLTASPTSISFGSVPVGTTYSHLVQFKNTGRTDIIVSRGAVTGGGFKMTAYSYPFTIFPGQTLNTTVTFTPTATGSAAGSLTFTSNASDKTLSVALSGNGGSATRSLSASTTSLNFGNVTLGKSEMLPVTLKNTGTSSLTVSSVTVSGANITTSGGISGATIAPGQSATLDVSFSPSKVESVSGKVVVLSNASNSTLSIAVSAVGASSTQHSVSLIWSPSTSSNATGYYVYRALSPGTSFTRMSAAPISTTRFTDTSVVSGDTYEYEVTAVSSTGIESPRSAPVTAVIP
jgi:hypothetical protein